MVPLPRGNLHGRMMRCNSGPFCVWKGALQISLGDGKGLLLNMVFTEGNSYNKMVPCYTTETEFQKKAPVWSIVIWPLLCVGCGDLGGVLVWLGPLRPAATPKNLSLTVFHVCLWKIVRPSTIKMIKENVCHITRNKFPYPTFQWKRIWLAYVRMRFCFKGTNRIHKICLQRHVLPIRGSQKLDVAFHPLFAITHFTPFLNLYWYPMVPIVHIFLILNEIPFFVHFQLVWMTW